MYDDDDRRVRRARRVRRVRVRCVSRSAVTSTRIASHRIASHRIASHRIASHRIASHRIVGRASRRLDRPIAGRRTRGEPCVTEVLRVCAYSMHARVSCVFIFICVGVDVYIRGVMVVRPARPRDATPRISSRFRSRAPWTSERASERVTSERDVGDYGTYARAKGGGRGRGRRMRARTRDG